MKLFKSLSITLLFSLAVFVTVGFGQTNTGTATGSGTVLQPLDVTSTGNLTFSESIFPGRTETINPVDGPYFAIDGENGKEVDVAFTIPDLALSTDASTTLDVTYTAEYDDSFDRTNVQTHDPEASSLLTNLEAATGELHVWLGGTVNPTTDQAAGEYSADLEIVVTYTGQ